MITTWLFEFMHALRDDGAAADPAKVREHFRFYGDLWVNAERRGFDGIFFSEHHFGAAYSPSPHLLVANVAARTSTLRLGVLGTVTPYATPWRIAEEFAMLDAITAGRFEPGVVSGIPPEFITANIDFGLAASRHESIASTLSQTLQSGTLTVHSDEWNVDNLPIFPLTTAVRDVWTAARTPESAVKAARRGWRLAVGFNSTENLRRLTDAYQEAAAEAGQPTGPDRIGLRRLVRFSDGEARRREAMHESKKSLLTLLERSAGPLPPFAALLDRPDETSEMLSDDEFVTGTSEQIGTELRRQCEAIGAGHVMATFSVVEPAELDESHELFGTEVIPILHRH